MEFAFPRCQGDALDFHVVDAEDHLQPVPGYLFREPDPAHCKRVAVSAIDAIIVPGLAFSASGSTRLGRGGGFYDRILADPSLRATILGVCFALQVREDLPREEHDRGVDEVITER